MADTFNSRIQKYDVNGKLFGQIGSKGSGDTQFNEPRGVAVDSNNNIFTVEVYNARVQKFRQR